MPEVTSFYELLKASNYNIFTHFLYMIFQSQIVCDIYIREWSMKLHSVVVNYYTSLWGYESSYPKLVGVV